MILIIYDSYYLSMIFIILILIFQATSAVADTTYDDPLVEDAEDDEDAEDVEAGANAASPASSMVEGWNSMVSESTYVFYACQCSLIFPPT